MHLAAAKRRGTAQPDCESTRPATPIGRSIEATREPGRTKQRHLLVRTLPTLPGRTEPATGLARVRECWACWFVERVATDDYLRYCQSGRLPLNSGPSLTAQLHLKFHTAVSTALCAGTCSACPLLAARPGVEEDAVVCRALTRGALRGAETAARDSNTEPSEKLVNVTHSHLPT